MGWFGDGDVVLAHDATTLLVTDPPCRLHGWSQVRERHETWVGSVMGGGPGLQRDNRSTSGNRSTLELPTWSQVKERHETWVGSVVGGVVLSRDAIAVLGTDPLWNSHPWNRVSRTVHGTG